MKHKIPKLGAMMLLTVGITVFIADKFSAPIAPPEHNRPATSSNWKLNDVVENSSPAEIEKTLGIELPQDSKGVSQIPRIFVKDLPPALTTEQNVKRKKQLFAAALLPLILHANEKLLVDRSYMTDLENKWRKNGTLSTRDMNWLHSKGRTFRVDTQKPLSDATFEAFLERIDVIPPSLALAQGAIESGWGTSRFAQSGNALFGEWVWGDDEKGILPERRNEGATHKIKSFEYLYDSVESYMINLNRHVAYTDLRKRRRELRDHNLTITGAALAPALIKYSERGEAYVNDVLSIINFNGFNGLDNARLAAA